jgi:hypothetical protein
MNRKKLIETASIAAVSLAIGVAAVFLFNGVMKEIKARRGQADLEAQIARVTPARDLVVMYADATVFAGAKKQELLYTRSTLYYISRARFIYSVDMKALKKPDFHYDPDADVLKVKIPNIKVQSYLYGERERIAALSPLTAEAHSGEMERVAASALERNADQESHRPEVVKAATVSAKYEIGKLYEDALRASGKKTRVIVEAR